MRLQTVIVAAAMVALAACVCGRQIAYETDFRNGDTDAPPQFAVGLEAGATHFYVFFTVTFTGTDGSDQGGIQLSVCENGLPGACTLVNIRQVGPTGASFGGVAAGTILPSGNFFGVAQGASDVFYTAECADAACTSPTVNEVALNTGSVTGFAVTADASGNKFVWVADNTGVFRVECPATGACTSFTNKVTVYSGGKAFALDVASNSLELVFAASSCSNTNIRNDVYIATCPDAACASPTVALVGTGAADCSTSGFFLSTPVGISLTPRRVVFYNYTSNELNLWECATAACASPSKSAVPTPNPGFSSSLELRARDGASSPLFIDDSRFGIGYTVWECDDAACSNGKFKGRTAVTGTGSTPAFSVAPVASDVAFTYSNYAGTHSVLYVESVASTSLSPTVGSPAAALVPTPLALLAALVAAVAAVVLA